MEFTDLEKLLAPDADLGVLVTLLSGLTEKQRRALSGPLRKAIDGSNPAREAGAVYLAVLGCVTGARTIADFISWRPLDAVGLALASRVLADRQPPWLAGFGEQLMTASRPGAADRRLVRQLVRDGVIPTPAAPNYALCLPGSLAVDWRDPRGALDALQDDPGLLEHEIWELFVTEGSGLTLRNIDANLTAPWHIPGTPKPSPSPERTWRHALVTLSADGRIDRRRLLDETLTAGLRDWKAADTGWFMECHGALAPTLPEALARQSIYLRLLGAEPGPTVMLAQRQLRMLVDAGQADLAGLIDASAAALSRADKGPVVAQLRLLEAAAAKRPDQRAAIARAATTALSHGRLEIQERARALIETLDPTVAAPQVAAPTVAAPQVAAPQVAAPQVAAPQVAAPQVTAQPYVPVAPRPAPPIRRVTPVADPEELAELLARLLEDASDPIDVERALEAGVRLAGRRPRGDGAALAARAEATMAAGFQPPWSGQEMRSDLAAFTLSWLVGRPVGPAPPGRHVATDYPRASLPNVGLDALSQIFNAAEHRFAPDWTLTTMVALRMREAALAVLGGGERLLSLPTHRDGALDPGVISERVGAMGRTATPLPLDLGQAALRVAPGVSLSLPTAHRTARALKRHRDVLAAYRPRWELVCGPSAGSYSRDNLERAVSWRDTAGTPGNPADLVAGALDRTDPLRTLAPEAWDGEYSDRFDCLTALWPVMLPHHPELLAAHAHARLNRALTKNRNATEPLIDALARARQRTGPVVCSALVMGASAKNGPDRIRVVDALVELADARLLDGVEFGVAIQTHLAAGVITANRVVETLAEAVRAGESVLRPLFDAVAPLLPALVGRRDAHLFVDLLAALASRVGEPVRLPPELAAVRDGRAKTVLAGALRRLPTGPRTG